MKIEILGPGCKNCQTLEQNTRQALSRLGMAAEVAKVTDMAEIASYGILKTPGLVIDGEVVMSGRVPAPEAIAGLIRAA
jgi:small redox-active disulfide protein 2